jgi:hypothetical protein
LGSELTVGTVEELGELGDEVVNFGCLLTGLVLFLILLLFIIRGQVAEFSQPDHLHVI